MPRELSSEDFEAVRTRIGAAAATLYAAGGVGAITMRDIAKALGRSRWDFTAISPIGKRFLAFVRADAFDRFSDALETAFASGADAFARAPRSRPRLSRFALAHPNAYRLMFDLDPPDEARHPELRRAGKRAGETVTRHVKDLVAAGIVQGDPKIIGNALWAASHWRDRAPSRRTAAGRHEGRGSLFRNHAAHLPRRAQAPLAKFLIAIVTGERPWLSKAH